MRPYRYYFMNAANMITAADDIECANDHEAEEVAVRLLRERSTHSVEVWDQSRKVYGARNPGTDGRS
jgi:hypothetical protein